MTRSKKVKTTKKIPKKSAPKKSTKPQGAQSTESKQTSPESHPLVGQQIPDISLQNQRGETVSISNLVNSAPKVVLYFYPKDDTPGCTTEACGFRDNFSRIQSLGVNVFGVSPDDVTSHQKFIEKYHLNFDLLADTEHKLCEALKIWKEKSFMGRTYLGVERSTFVFHNGQIIWGWQPVKVDGHVDEVISKLSSLG